MSKYALNQKTGKIHEAYWALQPGGGFNRLRSMCRKNTDHKNLVSIREIYKADHPSLCQACFGIDFSIE